MVVLSRVFLSWSVLRTIKLKHGLNACKARSDLRRVTSKNFNFTRSEIELAGLQKLQTNCTSFHTCEVVRSKNAAPGEKSSKQSKHLKKGKEIETIQYTIPTREGEKKDVSSPLPKKYSWEYVEAAWYPWWEKSGFFKPDIAKNGSRHADGSDDVFMMCLPPPNVTGVLHLGHAMTCSIQDAITRWNRMHGRVTLWNPGSDHAGISTQVVVEKKLWKERQLTRHDLGREAFLEEVWSWKHEKGSKIYEQMKKLGASLDWSRECFTLDPKLGGSVTEAFVRLHDAGLIYRSHRMVNWCCALHSAISDIEVDNIALDGRTFLEVPVLKKKVEFGTIHSFAYPVFQSDEEIVIATTRMETMLGDTAVAVHPSDARYRHLHGKRVVHPLSGATIPIICDEFVDQEFGTGAVKITPAHDQNDYDVGMRHSLPHLTVIDDTGHMTDVPEEFMGMHRFEARSKIISALKKKGFYRGLKDNPMVLPVCSRTGDVIEPKLKDQWFVNCTEMAQHAVQVVQNKELTLIPNMYEKQWYHWLGNIKDWCISRQLWWGHRIPAYKIIGHKGKFSDEDLWIVGRTKDEALERAIEKYKLPASDIKLEQDEDVLDTWFSSSLFPFSIFGWPDTSPDYQRFYPNSMLETANDILFFWVARMVMMGHKLTGQLPFEKVLLHGVLRDAQGRKMSKSLGNVIDPMDVIQGTSLENLWKQLDEGNLPSGEVKKARKAMQHEFPQGIPACGTDALRFTLCSYNYKAISINMDIQLIIKNRNFCNKMWQAYRFFSDYLGVDYKPQQEDKLNGDESQMDLWILSRMSAMLAVCDRSFAEFDLHHATEAIQQFWIQELCDIYLEYVKPIFQSEDEQAIRAAQRTAHTCVDVTIRAVSPFMPYLSEELYQRWPSADPNRPASVCIAPYPKAEQYDFRNLHIENDMTLVLQVIHRSLTLRSLFSLTKARAAVYLHVEDAWTLSLLRQYADAMKVLSRSSNLTLSQDFTHTGAMGLFSVNIQPGITLHMQLQDVIEYEKCEKNLRRKKEQISKKLKDLEKVKTEENDQEKEALLLEELHITEQALQTISTLQ